MTSSKVKTLLNLLVIWLPVIAFTPFTITAFKTLLVIFITKDYASIPDPDAGDLAGFVIAMMFGFYWFSITAVMFAVWLFAKATNPLKQLLGKYLLYSLAVGVFMLVIFFVGVFGKGYVHRAEQYSATTHQSAYF